MSLANLCNPLNGGAVGSSGGAGTGTVTVVGAGSLTSTALVTGGGSQTVQTPSSTATLDASGNLSTPGSVSTGVGGSVGGYAAFGQGTATTAPTASVGFMAPASVGTKFMMTLPGSPATGFLLNTGASDPSTLSFVTGAGQGTPTTTSIGYQGVPQNSQSADYTTVMADSGKEIYHPVGDANSRTFTIDSNANVAYPIGTVIIFTNMSANNVTISITSDTLYWFGTGGTGSRTLAQYGTAAVRKLTSTTWGISGINLT